MNLTNKEIRAILTYNHLVNETNNVVVIGGSLNLKLRGLLTRDCDDLDIIIDNDKIIMNSTMEFSGKIYDINGDGVPDAKYHRYGHNTVNMNRLGELVPCNMSDLISCCVFYNENISYDNADPMVVNGITVYLQKLYSVLDAKEYYAKNAREEYTREKHKNDLLTVKLTQFV